MTTRNETATRAYMAMENLYNSNGKLIFQKDHEYKALTEDEDVVIGEDGAFYHIPFVEIKDKKDKANKDNFGGLFLIEIQWFYYPPEGGCTKQMKEQIIQAFNTGHELADYLNDYKANLIKDCSNRKPRITKIERI